MAEKETVPCIVRDLTDDEATIIMADPNLQKLDRIGRKISGLMRSLEYFEPHDLTLLVCSNDINTQTGTLKITIAFAITCRQKAQAKIHEYFELVEGCGK